MPGYSRLQLSASIGGMITQPGETVDYRWVDTKTLRALLETDRCMHARMLRTTKLSNCEEDIK